MENTALQITAEQAPTFTDKELKALNDYLVSGKAKNLAPDAAANFLVLYLEGRSIADIHKTFPQWPKGALLYARYFYKWDEQRQEYFMELASKVRDRLIKCRADTANMLMDKLAVTNKEFAKEMEKYLQHATDSNLPKNRIKSVRELRDTIAALKEILLFQASEQSTGANVTVNVNTDNNNPPKIIITPQEQSNIFDKLLEEGKKKE
jgi:hypothetical protein